MSITYVQKNVNAVQTKRKRAVSLSDFSSQNESLQCKTHLMNGFAQYSQIAQNNQKLNKNYIEMNIDDYEKIESMIDSMTTEEELIESHKNLNGKT